MPIRRMVEGFLSNKVWPILMDFRGEIQDLVRQFDRGNLYSLLKTHPTDVGEVIRFFEDMEDFQLQDFLASFVRDFPEDGVAAEQEDDFEGFEDAEGNDVVEDDVVKLISKTDERFDYGGYKVGEEFMVMEIDNEFGVAVVEPVDGGKGFTAPFMDLLLTRKEGKRELDLLSTEKDKDFERLAGVEDEIEAQGMPIAKLGVDESRKRLHGFRVRLIVESELFHDQILRTACHEYKLSPLKMGKRDYALLPQIGISSRKMICEISRAIARQISKRFDGSSVVQKDGWNVVVL